MLLIWLVGAGFLYWPFREWKATYQAPFLSALLWPFMVAIFIGWLLFHYLRVKTGDFGNIEPILEKKLEPSLQPVSERKHKNFTKPTLDAMIYDTKLHFALTKVNIPSYFIEGTIRNNKKVFQDLVTSNNVGLDEKNQIVRTFILQEWLKSEYGKDFYQSAINLTDSKVSQSNVESLADEFIVAFHGFYQDVNQKRALAKQIYHSARNEYKYLDISGSDFGDFLELEKYSKEFKGFHYMRELELDRAMVRRRNRNQISYKDYNPEDEIDPFIKGVDMAEVNYLIGFLTDHLSVESRVKLKMSIVQGLLSSE